MTKEGQSTRLTVKNRVSNEDKSQTGIQYGGTTIREAQEFEGSQGKGQRDGSVGAKPDKPEFNPLDPMI